VERLNNFQLQFFEKFLDQKQNVFAVSVFCKALVVFVIVKIGMIWTVSSSIVALHKFIPSSLFVVRILFSPAQWASEHLTLFYSFSLVFLVVILFIRWNYINGLVFFLLVINLYRINLPITNGSDYVLFMLAFWAMLMSRWPILKNENGNAPLILLFNISVVLCQLQIVFIYLISGWDKVTSRIWRSGDAIDYITHLDFFFSQPFGFPNNHFINLSLSWITIAFELAFVSLVWFNRTRKVVLVLGVLFHLIIWFMLSLPDFALIMIISYLIFLKDEDYKSVQGLKFKVPDFKS
jgi:hypothetical protein